MKYLSVLTPPLLVCIVVLIAIVAFLRHEMGPRRRSPEDGPAADIPAGETIPGDDADAGGGRAGSDEPAADNKPR